MRRNLMLIVASVFSVALWAQTAQKPIVMVVPEKAWCQQKGYTKNGTVDYEKALMNNDILNSVTRMGSIMAERGYPLKLLSATLDELKNEASLDVALTSHNNGGEIQEDELDRLLRVAGADIVVNIAFNRTKIGPRSQVEFRVTGVDAATQKQITGDVGLSSASSAPVSALVDEAVQGFMDSFSSQLMRHFQQTIQKGREGTFIFKIASDCPLNFESEVNIGGETGELAEYIEYWIAQHAKDDSFTQGGKSRVRLSFEQVHFPLFGKGSFGGRQKAINAEGFIRPISQDLGNLGLSVSITPIGIGKAYVVLGRK